MFRILARSRPFSTPFRRTYTKRSFTREEIEKIQEFQRQRKSKDISSVALYALSAVIYASAVVYATVPLYRALCSRTGFGGTPLTDQTKFTPEHMRPVERDQRITVKFSAEVSNQMPWSFKPEQREVRVLPGETALAFYKAKNNSDKPLIGMATYTVVPERAAAYFSKIQCFCFEEQMLQPGEEIDMPVFFFIDPDYARDPKMANINDVILHYTFFKAQYKEGDEAKIAEELSKGFRTSTVALE